MKNIDKHYGEIIEKVVRRNGYSISELARLAEVNRRSIYNWFNQQKLKPEVIYKIGCALRHDFSNEFPELFTSADFQQAFEIHKSVRAAAVVEEKERINYWKDKYINLLEEYNQLLTSKTTTGFSSFFHTI